jgi:glycine cleavage system H protein
MSRDEAKLLYAQTHEWVDISDEDGQQVATIGISAFALEQLGDLVYMDLPEVGKSVSAGEEFGEVESVKAVSPLYSPVTGEVIDVHSELPDRLEELSDDPYDFGWIVKVRVSDPQSGMDKLMDRAAYQKQCAESV